MTSLMQAGKQMVRQIKWRAYLIVHQILRLDYASNLTFVNVPLGLQTPLP